MKQNPEPKIVKLYHQLFEEENLNVVKTDEFFLLRPHLQHLGSLFNGWPDDETLQKKKHIIQALISSILRILEGEQGLKVFNACQTLGVITNFVGKKVESIPQAQCLLLPGTPEDFAKVFSQRCRDVIIGDSSLTLKTCFLNTLLTIWSSFPKCLNNPLIINFCILLQLVEESKQNQFKKRLSELEDNIGIIPPHTHDHIITDQEQQISNGNNSNVFSLFLSFSSFVFADFDSKQQQDQTKLCLLILWHIINEPYVQNAIQDMHLSTNISLYKSPMLHRSASFAPISATPITLSTALLELLTDFNSTHLKHNFPFLHYHLSLSITHRILIYHKKCKIRLRSWRPLFNSLVSIINYLSQNLTKLPNDEAFHLLYRSLLVVNFFITYGDTFLPDAAAYDFLYYEISRQSTVFARLGKICKNDDEEQLFQVDKTCECFPKVANQLINILSIIEHIRPKLEVLAHSYLTEEQVINIVQQCFNDLTLKLYEGLENVEFKDEKNLENFLESLTEDMPHSVNAFWSEKIDFC
uniref:Armadillo-like helical domain-containing protein n=1 Tax=Panagrolaimus superbus TaxID=310955 RepID=A0A914Y6H7_9BILA